MRGRLASSWTAHPSSPLEHRDDAVQHPDFVRRHAARTPPIAAEERAVLEHTEPGVHRAQPELVVLVPRVRGIEAADPLDDLPAEDRKHGHGVLMRDRFVSAQLVCAGRDRPERRAVERAATADDIRADDRDFRMLAEQRQLRRQVLRFPHIVAVEQREALASRVLQPDVSGHGGPTVRAGEALHAGVAPGSGSHDVEGAVGRAVVDDQQFEVGPRLLKDRFDGLRDVRRRVERGRQDADDRTCARHSPAFCERWRRTILIVGHRLPVGADQTLDRRRLSGRKIRRWALGGCCAPRFPCRRAWRDDEDPSEV